MESNICSSCKEVAGQKFCLGFGLCKADSGELGIWGSSKAGRDAAPPPLPWSQEKGFSLLQPCCPNLQPRAKPAVASHADMHSWGTNVVLNPFNGPLETKGFSSPKSLGLGGDAVAQPCVAKAKSCSSSNSKKGSWVAKCSFNTIGQSMGTKVGITKSGLAGI